MNLVKMQFGSHVYGTNLPTSDHDYKAIHVPPARDIVLQRPKNTITHGTKADKGAKNSADDVDFESFSLQRYLKLLCEGQTVALSMLFTPREWWSETSVCWLLIQAERERFLHKQITPFVGYCRQQANKYGIKGSRVAAARAAKDLFWGLMNDGKHSTHAKLKDVWDQIEVMVSSPANEHMAIVKEEIRGGSTYRMLEVCNKKVQENATLKDAYDIYNRIFTEYGHRALQAEKQENVDWKALMHACRVLGEAEELLKHKTITYPRPDAKFLLDVRQGLLPYQEVADFIELGFIDLEHYQAKSDLPDAPDYDFAEELVHEMYKQVIV